MGVLKKAREFATRKHEGQEYGPNKPYTYHLEQVAQVATDHELPLDIRVAAWLHDTLEDTETTVQELAEAFGAEVAVLVVDVTDSPGQNRKERTAFTWPRIRDMGWKAVALKLCDRIANVEACVLYNPKLLKMYRKEQDRFKQVMYIEGELEDLWRRLEAAIA